MNPEELERLRELLEHQEAPKADYGGVPGQSATDTPVPHRRIRGKAPMAVTLALVVLLSSSAGFGGGYLASRMTPDATPTTAPTAIVEPTDTPRTQLTTVDITGSDALTLSQIAEVTAPSVVEIRATVTYTDRRGRTYSGEGAGSGVILTKDGFIVTNQHVVDGATKIAVRLHDGTTYSAVLVDSNATEDLAVLKISAENLTPVAIGKSGDLAVGDTAIAVGNPLGELGGTVTQGIISALDRSIDFGDGQVMNLLQTDAAINPGNSGGALFNDRAELVGIVNAKTSGTGLEGLGFAIPIDHAKPLIEAMMAKGS